MGTEVVEKVDEVGGIEGLMIEEVEDGAEEGPDDEEEDSVAAE